MHAHFHSGIANSPSLHSVNCSFLCRQGLQCISLNSFHAFASFTIFRRKPDEVFGITYHVLGNEKEVQPRGSAFPPVRIPDEIAKPASLPWHSEADNPRR